MAPREVKGPGRVGGRVGGAAPAELAAVAQAGGLPPLSPWLQLGDAGHQDAYESYVRGATWQKRLWALLSTLVGFAALSQGDATVTTLAAMAISAAIPTPTAFGGAQALCAGALVGACWALTTALAAAGGGTLETGSMLLALHGLALMQLAISHQLLLPWRPALPALISIAAPPLLLFAHPACAGWAIRWRLAFVLILTLLALVHLVVGYAASTIWLNEWLLQHFRCSTHCACALGE